MTYSSYFDDNPHLNPYKNDPRQQLSRTMQHAMRQVIRDHETQKKEAKRRKRRRREAKWKRKYDKMSPQERRQTVMGDPYGVKRRKKSYKKLRSRLVGDWTSLGVLGGGLLGAGGAALLARPNMDRAPWSIGGATLGGLGGGYLGYRLGSKRLKNPKVKKRLSKQAQLRAYYAMRERKRRRDKLGI